MSELDLMRQVFTRCGGTIRAAAAANGIDENFLAALVAGESGGDFNAKQFEKNVLASLWEVLLGRKAAFGSIGRTDLQQYVFAAVSSGTGVWGRNPAEGIEACNRTLFALDGLATSWGLTQIMGYHTLTHVGWSVDRLRDPAANLYCACVLLKEFIAEYHLNPPGLAVDPAWAAALFTCWNTGRPDGHTFDPNYVANGQARMALYPEAVRLGGGIPWIDAVRP